MNYPTLEQFKAWAKIHKKLAMTVVAAKAVAQVTRERVDEYTQPIFEKYGFKADSEVMKKTPDYGKPLDTPKDLYMTDDPRCTEFYAECDEEHKRQGFDVKPGYCPALVAENALIKAENALLEAGSELMGVNLIGISLENRKKALEILLGACAAKQ